MGFSGSFRGTERAVDRRVTSDSNPLQRLLDGIGRVPTLQ
jgi:hypothetical protein